MTTSYTRISDELQAKLTAVDEQIVALHAEKNFLTECKAGIDRLNQAVKDQS